MKTVKSIHSCELPKWFTAERYLRLKKCSVYEIDNELSLRRQLDIESKKGNLHLSEYEDLFNPPSERTNCNIEPDQNEFAPDENVKPLAILDVIQMAETLKKKGENSRLSPEDIFKPVHLTEAVQSNHSIDGTGIFVGISLSHATNSEIIDELLRLLQVAREQLYNNKQLERKKPKRFNLHELYESLFFWPVFEYLDLTIWARTKSFKLSRNYYREAFDSLRYRKFEPHHISGSVKRNAEHAISFEFAEQLNHLRKNTRKVNNFNPS